MFIEYLILILSSITLLYVIHTDTEHTKTINFIKTEPNAKLPTRATAGSAGHDFYLPKTVVINAHETVMVDSGIKVDIPKGYVLMLYPRSSLGIKNRIILANTTGIIDSDYKDTIKLPLHNYDELPVILNKGDRVAQAVCVPYITTKAKPLSEERIGGIGSTGRN